MKIRNLMLLLCILTLIPAVIVKAQVTFVVENLPATTPPGDNLYIAGDFTGWDPGAAAYVMHKNEQDKWNITLPARPEGTVLKFKFTRGSWETVEKGAAGEEIADRTFTFGNGSTISVTILNWADDGGGPVSTAAVNVSVMDENFFIPQLGRSRRIWLYLPPAYETSGISYPVMYMHDGQNLFDVFTAYSGEWEVDEALNDLASQGHSVPIVVGIDHGGTNRIGEYTPWSNPDYGGGEGDLYIRFIVETLKPYIDQHYRTLPDRSNTALMGSSLGGLISHYGALKYQEVFSKAGIFSPSYWFSDSVWAYTMAQGRQHSMRLYQLCGTLEGSNTVGNLLRMNDTLIKAGFSQEEIFNKVVAGGQHNEALWRNNFAEAYLWLFEAGSQAMDDQKKSPAILCFPNPVGNELTLAGLQVSLADSVEIYSITGQRVKTLTGITDNKIAIGDLKPGTYLLRLTHMKMVLEGKFIRE
ncbi:MAG: alpha/beta hydrolase-fold protein [Lentimicrobium sp.]